MIKLVYVEDLGTDQHHKAQLDACRMAKRNLGFLLFLLISPLKALPGAKPLAKSDPGENNKTHPNPILLDVLWSPGARLLQVFEPGVSVESRVSAAAARSSSISVARKV